MPHWCGPHCNGRPHRGWPRCRLWCWLLTVAGLTFGGPGDDIVFGGVGIMEYAPLLLIVLGALPPAWCCGAMSARPPDGYSFFPVPSF